MRGGIALHFPVRGPTNDFGESDFLGGHRAPSAGSDALSGLACRGPRANHPSARIPLIQFYLLIVCLVGVTVDVGAAFEIAKVSQTFHPSGRFSERNSR